MQLMENDYEQKLLQALPPHARDVADDLLNATSLRSLLSMLEANTPDKNLLSPKNVPSGLWLPILNATLLAKCTYFLPNDRFSSEELLFLMRTACMSAGYPLGEYQLREILSLTKNDMPIFHHWLIQFTQKLQLKKQPEA